MKYYRAFPIKFIKYFLFFQFLFADNIFAELPTKIKSLRVDPSYFYDLFPGKSAEQMAKEVVQDASSAKINTLFIYAYNSYWGAFYPTNYNYTSVEDGLGKLDIFGLLLKEARAANISVVAAMPLNDFRRAWEKFPSWRSKNRNGSDYLPFNQIHLLSAYHPGVQSWLQGFFQDFLEKYPGVEGIEAVEPMVDYFWNKDSDYNSAATTAFRKQYPNDKLGSAQWLQFRAQGITLLLALMSAQAHNYRVKSFVVQTWTAAANGALMPSSVLRDGFGFDFDEIANLQGGKKIDYLMAEIIWQQWAAEYGTPIFSPLWTLSAANNFITWLDNRATPLLHIELSAFDGSSGYVSVSNEEFDASLGAIKDLPTAGIDIYDYTQLTNYQAWTVLREMK